MGRVFEPLKIGNSVPRIQGKVGQATDPGEFQGKWFFEMGLTYLGQGHTQKSLGQFGPWETEEQAKKELKKAAQLVCETIEKNVVGKVSGNYIDMKTNETRKWEE